jgi:hypothetical protein
MRLKGAFRYSAMTRAQGATSSIRRSAPPGVAAGRAATANQINCALLANVPLKAGLEVW